MAIRKFIPAHAVEIFLHAAKHNYSDLMNASSSYIAPSPMVPMLKKLPGYALVPLVTLQRFTHTIVPLTKHQVKYRAAWDAMFECAILHLQSSPGPGTTADIV